MRWAEGSRFAHGSWAYITGLCYSLLLVNGLSANQIRSGRLAEIVHGWYNDSLPSIIRLLPHRFMDAYVGRTNQCRLSLDSPCYIQLRSIHQAYDTVYLHDMEGFAAPGAKAIII